VPTPSCAETGVSTTIMRTERRAFASSETGLSYGSLRRAFGAGNGSEQARLLAVRRLLEDEDKEH
jgi:hypothetical protein